MCFVLHNYLFIKKEKNRAKQEKKGVGEEGKRGKGRKEGEGGEQDEEEKKKGIHQAHSKKCCVFCFTQFQELLLIILEKDGKKEKEKRILREICPK